MNIEGLNTNESLTLSYDNGVRLCISIVVFNAAKITVEEDDWDPFADDSQDEQDLKSRLLKKYREREPRLFLQYDAFTKAPWDDIVRPDDDGDAICWGDTHELMSGIADVRALINPALNGLDVARVLRKFADIIEEDSKDGLYNGGRVEGGRR
ncbi:MAG: hypothetical protein HYX78_06575 [Armatimonadetes bacterium]|nr:hypothetical protein [Armatimonadota bacterium]